MATLLAKFIGSKSKAEFGRKIGTSSASVCRWCSGDRLPNNYFAQRIAEATSEAVPVTYWAGLQGRNLRRAHRRHRTPSATTSVVDSE